MYEPIKKGKEEEFKEWLEWSDTVNEKFNEFMSRRFLKTTKGKKNSSAIVEQESEMNFMTVRLSEERQKVLEKAEPLLEVWSTHHLYEVIISSEKKGK